MVHRLTAVVVVGLLLAMGVAHAISVDGNLNDWGYWGSTGGSGWRYDSASPSNQFVNNYQFTPNQGVQFQTAWGQTNNLHGGAAGAYDIAHNSPPNSGTGGEWFDIEGLYVTFSRETNGSATNTYLNWAIITSDSGYAPNEWRPNYGSGDPAADTGAAVPGGAVSGYNYANGRDGVGTTHGFNYHLNPVIGFDLGGGMDWALVLDASGPQNPLNAHSPNGIQNKGKSFQTNSVLYQVTAPTAWVSVIPGQEFGFPDSPYYPGSEYQFVDINTGAGGVTQRGSGTSVRGIGPSEQHIPNQLDQQMGPDSWLRMDYNWCWEGKMDVTNLVTGDNPLMNISNGNLKKVSYGLWCGNDWATANTSADLTEFIEEPATPELSTWALLGCTGLFGMWGFGWRRRKTD